MSTVLVRARIRFVPANETIGVAGSATEKLLVETAAFMSKGVATQAVRVPVIPRVAVRVVVPTNAVPVLSVQDRTVALAGRANTVTLCVVAAALATVDVVPSGLVMSRFVDEFATVHLAT